MTWLRRMACVQGRRLQPNSPSRALFMQLGVKVEPASAFTSRSGIWQIAGVTGRYHRPQSLPCRFLANDAVQNLEFHTTESGLKYQDTVVGTGGVPQHGSLVQVHYTGKLDDGSIFDCSRERGQPLTFTIGRGQVIKGWDEGIGSMAVGGKRTLIIPPALAYGGRGAGDVVPPNATLTFDCELLSVGEKAQSVQVGGLFGTLMALFNKIASR